MKVYEQSLFLPSLALARAKSRKARQVALEAIARTSRLGDRLARIEEPANRLGRILAELSSPDPWSVPPMLYRKAPPAGVHLSPAGRVDRTV